MKYSFLILILAISFLYSCHNGDSKVYTIGVSQCSDDEWRRTMNQEIKREADYSGEVKVLFTCANNSNQEQIRNIERLIADHVDLIIVSPNEAIPLTPVIEKAINEGIPVVLVDRKANTSKYTAFIGADNRQIGKDVGLYAVNLLKGKGNIVEIRGLNGSTPEFERHEGFNGIIETYPNIKIVSAENCDWLRNQAKKKMQEILDTGLDIDLVFAHNDEMAIGVNEAIEANLKLKKRPIILGIDALPGAQGGIQKVLDGKLDATFIYPTGGEKALQIALRILKKESYKRENSLYSAIVDRTNARVLKLQTDQILQHQKRISALNNVLNRNLTLYSAQRLMLYFSLLVLLIILILLALLFRSNRHKNKVNAELEIRNTAINQQKEQLAEQRDQLLLLSKNLEEATQSKLTFFTNISHEFRTPLTLLNGPLEIIAKESSLSQNGQNMVRLMKKNVLILRKLIDQIIEFRSLENGKMQMFFILGDLAAFMQNIVDSFSEYARMKHIRLTFTAEQHDFTVWYDSDKMEKICYNIISNAIKYTPEYGTIKLTLKKNTIDGDAFAIISCKDSGPGIPGQYLDHIFERYFRIDHSTSGSGLGLALTKMLVELHNGSINVESIEGKGAVFHVSIPFKQSDIAVSEYFPILKSTETIKEEMPISEELENDHNFDENVPKQNPVILIVEDNSDMRFYIKGLLRDEFDIIEASNGQLGYIKAIKFIPDLIISDVMMDVMDGFELCNQLKSTIETSHIPVILLTACTQEKNRKHGFEQGADAYISKPFDEEILKIRVRKIIENRERIKIYFQNNFSFGEARKDEVTEIDKSLISKFHKLIEERLIDCELNVDEIGKALGLSRVHLYRKIKSLTNYAPNELVRIIRLKASEKMLIQTDLSISEIAFQTGFSSPSYFTKCFKEYFNESPSEFLKRIK